MHRSDGCDTARDAAVSARAWVRGGPDALKTAAVRVAAGLGRAGSIKDRSNGASLTTSSRAGAFIDFLWAIACIAGRGYKERAVARRRLDVRGHSRDGRHRGDAARRRLAPTRGPRPAARGSRVADAYEQ